MIGALSKEQHDFIHKMEMILACMVHDGKKKWARAWAPIVEWLHKGEPVIAVLEAEANGIDENTIESLRIAFDIRKWS